MPSDDLIYHAGALGDFITVWPALECRRNLGPAGRTVLLSRAVHGRLAQTAGLVDEWWDVEEPRWIPLYQDRPQDGLPAHSPLGGIRSALVFAAPDSPLVAHLSYTGCRNLVCQEPFPRERCPVVDYHLGLFPPESRPRERFARLRSLARRCAGDLSPPGMAPRILIHPGSGSPAKNWPIARFREVAARLEREGFPVQWILGPADHLEVPGPCLRGVDLLTLAGGLAGSRLYLGNDSGVSHLAAAVGCPAVVIFGPTDAVVWAPAGERVTVVTAREVSPEVLFEPSPIEEVPLSAVMAAVEQELNRPAG